MKERSLLLSLLLVTGFAASHAIEIDFNSGYTPGPLAGQPQSGTQWHLTNGNVNFINVAAGIGIENTNGIVGTGTGSGSNYVYYGFDTSNADLGGSFDKDNTKVEYSFQWKPAEDLNTTDTVADIFTFAIGSNHPTAANAALKFAIRSNGVFAARHGSSNLTVNYLFNTSEYSRIYGTIDYNTKTYTVFIDNFQLFTTTNGGNLNFENASSDNAFIRLGNLNGADNLTNYRKWNADNISLSIVGTGSPARTHHQ